MVLLYLNSKIFLPSIIILGFTISFIVYMHIKKTKHFVISDINVYSVTIKLNMKSIDIAYMMYIQLRTRKIGIEFEDNDVIVEIYDSWYSAFKAIRELLLSIKPIPKNLDLIEVGMKILNQGMRPHLTKWQAKFKKWYELELLKDENKKLSPQEIQMKYPKYDELIKDIITSQGEILKFLDELEKIYK